MRESSEVLLNNSFSPRSALNDPGDVWIFGKSGRSGGTVKVGK